MLLLSISAATAHCFAESRPVTIERYLSGEMGASIKVKRNSMNGESAMKMGNQQSNSVNGEPDPELSGSPILGGISVEVQIGELQIRVGLLETLMSDQIMITGNLTSFVDAFSRDQIDINGDFLEFNGNLSTRLDNIWENITMLGDHLTKREHEDVAYVTARMSNIETHQSSTDNNVSRQEKITHNVLNGIATLTAVVSLILGAFQICFGRMTLAVLVMAMVSPIFSCSSYLAIESQDYVSMVNTLQGVYSSLVIVALAHLLSSECGMRVPPVNIVLCNGAAVLLLLVCIHLKQESIWIQCLISSVIFLSLCGFVLTNHERFAWFYPFCKVMWCGLVLVFTFFQEFLMRVSALIAFICGYLIHGYFSSNSTAGKIGAVPIFSSL